MGNFKFICDSISRCIVEGLGPSAGAGGLALHEVEGEKERETTFRDDGTT